MLPRPDQHFLRYNSARENEQLPGNAQRDAAERAFGAGSRVGTGDPRSRYGDVRLLSERNVTENVRFAQRVPGPA